MEIDDRALSDFVACYIRLTVTDYLRGRTKEKTFKAFCQSDWIFSCLDFLDGEQIYDYAKELKSQGVKRLSNTQIKY